MLCMVGRRRGGIYASTTVNLVTCSFHGGTIQCFPLPSEKTHLDRGGDYLKA
jgi:hypothetical protein